MPPTRKRCSIACTAGRVPTIGIGKIEDLFAGRGIARALHTGSDDEGEDAVTSEMASTSRGLIFANLVDFDTVYGHRNDVPGYASNLERFDARLKDLVPRLREETPWSLPPTMATIPRRRARITHVSTCRCW